LKVLIIEDEIVAANRLQEMLISYDSSLEIVGVLDSVIDAVNFLNNTTLELDIIFMDIQLSDGICFEIFEEIEINCPTIFTTAYDNYTLNAFKVNSVDYLLKPIDTEELVSSIEKFKKIHFKGNNYRNSTESLMQDLAITSNTFKYRFLIKTPFGFIPVSTNDIAYFYSEDKLTFLVTWKNEKHIVDISLEELITKLDPKDFFKISRSFIAHHNAIEKINYHHNNRLKLQLKPIINKDVFVSRNSVKNFKNWMNS